MPDYSQREFETEQMERLLCFLCKQIELGDNANFDCPEYKELCEWWEERKKLDSDKENKHCCQCKKELDASACKLCKGSTHETHAEEQSLCHHCYLKKWDDFKDMGR